MSAQLSDFDFELPRELVASRPLPDRAASRMMVVDRAAGTVTHRMFRDLPQHLAPGDLLVLNNSRVIPARLLTEDGRIELLLFEQLGPQRWKAFARPGKRTRPGDSFSIAGTTARIESVDEDDGTRVVRFESEPDLENLGHIPIPPYLGREDDAEDRVRYQTVYASMSGSGANYVLRLPDRIAKLDGGFTITIWSTDIRSLTDPDVGLDKPIVFELPDAGMNTDLENGRTTG